MADSDPRRRRDTASRAVPLHRRLAAAWTRLAVLPAPTPADRDAAWSAASTGMHPFHPRDAVWTALSSAILVPTTESETPAFIRSQANVIRLTLNDITAAESRLLDRYERALR